MCGFRRLVIYKPLEHSLNKYNINLCGYFFLLEKNYNECYVTGEDYAMSKIRFLVLLYK